MADSLSSYMDEYLAADAEGKAEIIGRVTVEAAMLLAPAGGLSRAGLGALRTAAQNSKLGAMTRLVGELAGKLGINSPSGISNFTDFTKKAVGNNTGAIGSFKSLERKAKKLKINFNSISSKTIVNNLDMKSGEFIGKFRRGQIHREFPREFLDMSVEEALRSGNSKVRKLLTDKRFLK